MSEYQDVDAHPPVQNEQQIPLTNANAEARYQQITTHIVNEENKHSSLNKDDIIVDIEHIPRRYIWRSCCLILDSRAVLFFSQLAISIVIMLFCIRQMVVLEDTDAQKNYGILLSFMIGLWFPAPKIGT